LGLEKSIQALKVQISNYPPAEMISLFRLVEFLGFDAAEDKNLGRETCDFWAQATAVPWKTHQASIDRCQWKHRGFHEEK